MERRPAIFCISTYEKGQAFLREAAALGCDVTLLTIEKHANGDWPKDSLVDFQTMPAGLTPEQVLNTVTYYARTHRIDRIVALDEFDLETAALLREHLRLPGMGQTATRFFRDKLAMRTAAKAAGIAVPDFSPVVNHEDIRHFLQNTQGPWLLKPRSSAAAIGIKRVGHPDEIWPLLEQLGDAASEHVLECFVPGEIFHVEGVTWDREVLFAAAHKYGKPPMQTMHHGGVFTTRTLDREDDDAVSLRTIHAATLSALGMIHGVTHSEFIKAHADGRFYFLETAARVGGAFIAEVVQYASGLNPWTEWARIEVARLRGERYHLPELRQDYAGSVICLARQEQPDLSAYADPEIVYRLPKHHHAGLIVRSDSAQRVESLLESYAGRFLEDFYARMDVPDRPTS
ncbi:ATP-grasp domain-containing protein [Granulicella mallensis]|uniref:ATP-dependent carboxylate-amine ligase domain-containing protein n=1 Tax=Granulicella mallensis (strain ATCC BAA-1857 / DSM 23137 / MP5ACTX8) TaxID=682795 RepID=G8NQE2_GRAMM|nr:ATPase [Granulicella mallensis]AEU36091.1 ATP-dependent carboxylate-amine ligase domain-containing protein [Granulicella mallensis MP5ACTX8]